jgi:hypothetical protein
MRAPAVLPAAVLLALAGWLGPAAAASECALPHRHCLDQCDAAFPPKPGDMGHAGCFSRCGWEQAVCEGRRALDETQAALERAKPLLEAEANRWQRFLDGFRQGGAGAPTGPEAAPQSRPTPPSRPAPTPELAPEPGSRRSTPL